MVEKQFNKATRAGAPIPPLIVSVAERPDRDGEGLPHWVQRVLHHLRLVADSKPGHTNTSED